MVLLTGCSNGGAEVTAAGWQEQYDLGLRYLSEGGYEEAVVAFTAAISIDPKQAVVYVGRGDAYVGLEQHETAVPDYEQAITLDESVAEVYIKLADSFVALGDVDRAREALERGLAATGDETISARLVELPQYIIFGSFQGEPLQWQVLAEEGDRALIITKDCVAVSQYKTAAWDAWKSLEGTTWENSSLRTWLNGSFFDEVFSITEKALIQSTNDDRVFLLSIEEARQYFVDDAARVAKHKWTVEELLLAEEQVKYEIAVVEQNLNEAKQNGDAESIANQENVLIGSQEWLLWVRELSASGQACWWLRSPGRLSNFAAFVEPDGTIYDDGGSVGLADRAVRPALWINLE
jgi:tetratricopeptide (TPR) repeat protein